MKGGQFVEESGWKVEVIISVEEDNLMINTRSRLCG